MITSEQFLEHWQGHRALTRRVIDAFPEDKLFNYAIGGMRPFSALAMEFPKIPAARFQEVDTAFGQWKMAIYDLLLYIRDNEIHHRGQGYVYLRSLGIEPPAFWERA